MNDLYKTITSPSEETLFKDRNSKFFGYAFPVLNEDDIKFLMEKKKMSISNYYQIFQRVLIA